MWKCVLDDRWLLASLLGAKTSALRGLLVLDVGQHTVVFWWIVHISGNAGAACGVLGSAMDLGWFSCPTLHHQQGLQST
jgi:hypothetical protein